MSDEEIEAIEGDYQGSDFFSEEEKSAMRWAEVFTEKGYQGAPGSPPVHKEALADLKKYYNDAQVVELSMVTGFFNFWNRFTDILEVDIEVGKTMNSFTKSKVIDLGDYTDYLNECWWNHHKHHPKENEQ